jgi:hypothetical protein
MSQDDSGTMYAALQLRRKIERLSFKKYDERVATCIPKMHLIGPGVQSATIMWELVESLFEDLTKCSEEVQFPGRLVGHFSGDEPLRAILPIELGKKPREMSSDATEGGYICRRHWIWRAADV